MLQYAVFCPIFIPCPGFFCRDEEAAAYEAHNFVNCDLEEDGGQPHKWTQCQTPRLARPAQLAGQRFYFGLGGTVAEWHPGNSGCG